MSGLSQIILQSHAGISLHIQSYTELYLAGISRVILGYTIAGFLNWDIQIQGFYIVLSLDIRSHHIPG